MRRIIKFSLHDASDRPFRPSWERKEEEKKNRMQNREEYAAEWRKKEKIRRRINLRIREDR